MEGVDRGVERALGLADVVGEGLSCLYNRVPGPAKRKQARLAGGGCRGARARLVCSVVDWHSGTEGDHVVGDGALSCAWTWRADPCAECELTAQHRLPSGEGPEIK